MIRAELVLALEPAVAFELAAEELRAALPDAPLRLDPPARIAVAWAGVAWAPEAVVRAELTVEPALGGTRITIELRGWDALLSAFGREDAELLAWFTQTVAAGAIRAGSPAAVEDWLIDRGARRPSGAVERRRWGAMHDEGGGHHQPGFDAILAALDLGPDDRLVEIGCGSGYLLRLALESGCRAAAIDHSADMVRVTRERNADALASGRLEVFEAKAEELPFADATFTHAASAHAFFFFDDPLRMLAECRRVLRDGGRLAVFTSGAELKGHPEAAPEPFASRMRFYEPDKLERLALEAGFASARVDADGEGGQLLVAEKVQRRGT